MSDDQSIFNQSESSTQPEDQTVVTDPQTNPTTPDPVSEYVGEGKKYQTVEDALKATDHAQAHIANLEKEQAELREELSRRLTMDEALSKIKAEQDNAGQPSVELDESKLEEIINSKLRSVEAQKTVATNINTVIEKLTAKYGDTEKAREAYMTKANELGLSIESLNKLSGESPTAVLSMLGVDTKQEVIPQTTQSSVNTESFTQGGIREGTYAYYENLRKTDPTTYFSPSVQNEMHRLAVENDNFYK